MQYTEYKERLKQLKCAVLIPTFNNESTIEGIVDDVLAYANDVIVVNDGSTDSTHNILHNKSGIQYIAYSTNQGKGYALMKGIKWATENGFNYVITIDADGQHFASDIPVFVQAIEKCPGALLIGSRNLQADNMPGKNTFANKFSNFWYKVETGKTLHDTQSGFRLYPVQSLKDIHLLSKKYEFEVEIIVRASWKGILVSNVPIHVYYPPKEERVSHFRPLHDFTRISILNSLLVTYALLFYYPWICLKSVNMANIKRLINVHILHNKESNIKLASAMGWGIFCGIIPIWGYQMLFAAVSAHFFKLNKAIALVFSNISIPPMIPFILFGSMYLGGLLFPEQHQFSIENITIESVTSSLLQYVIGSILLATLSGIVVFIVSYLLLIIFRKQSRNV